jgi:S1-C subfamily serine protease
VLPNVLLRAEKLEIQPDGVTKMKFTRNTLIFGIAIAGSAVVLSAQPADALRPVSTGSGFAISPDGYIITNNHVVTMDVKNKQGRIVGERVCRGVSVKGAGHNGRVRIVARDRKLDLAVVKLGSTKNRPTARSETRRGPRRVDEYEGRDQAYSRRTEEADRTQREPSSNLFESGNAQSRDLFESTPVRNFGGAPADDGFNSPAKESGQSRSFVPLNLARLEPGMKTNVIGFPQGERYSSQLKINTGVIVATVGLGDNTSAFQTDAAINKGNSGGPVIDQAGNLIGVAVRKIIKKGVEGFNFAIKSEAVARFLETHDVDFERAGHGAPRHSVNLYRDAKQYTVLVTCLN